MSDTANYPSQQDTERRMILIIMRAGEVSEYSETILMFTHCYASDEDFLRALRVSVGLFVKTANGLFILKGTHGYFNWGNFLLSNTAVPGLVATEQIFPIVSGPGKAPSIVVVNHDEDLIPRLGD